MILWAEMSSPLPYALLPVCLLAACENPCIHMCQQYERYLDRCGYGWSTVFEEEGWASIDDCYDDYWEAGEDEAGQCRRENERWSERACY